MIEVNRNFRRFSEAQMEVIFQGICSAMENNSYFPPPHPELTNAKAACEAFTAALAAAKSGDRTAIALKNQKKEDALQAFFTLGNYVMNVAGDNEAIIASANYRPRRDRGPQPPLEQPEINRLEPGLNEGEITVVVNRLPSARWYRFECTLDPTSGNWKSVESTRTKAPFEGLESGKVYHFRVTAFGIKGQQVTSNVVIKRVF